MNRPELIKWIRTNDQIYAGINLSIFSDKEFLFLKEEIVYYKMIQLLNTTTN